jgi:hypothetical protein
MNGSDLHELFAGAVAGEPADTLDVDRMVRDGRRRHRIRTAATISSVAAAVLLVAGIGLVRLPGQTASTPPVTSPTPHPSPSAPVIRTLLDWGDAVERGLPFADQVLGERAQADFDRVGTLHLLVPALGEPIDRVRLLQRAFHLTRDGRTTGLLVVVHAPGTFGSAAGTPEQVLARLCPSGRPDICTAIRPTASGPVMVIHRPGYVEAENLRPSGVLVSVISYAADFTPESTSGYVFNPVPALASGPPALAGDIDQLVAIAATVPSPALPRPVNATG